ncbi:Bacterio-opsin activator HTH domain protein [halophilic archaeon DL31]|jgi:predicted DNA binding protein|nr:Bacterio-opsin activator HTH domain protein [halophilic archaeon DL31]
MSNEPAVDETGAAAAFQRFVLDITHPDCWTLDVTQVVDAGLLGHGVYEVNGQSVGRFTAFADTVDSLDDLVAAIRASPLTDSVRTLPGRQQNREWQGTAADVVAPGNVTRGLLVRYHSTNSISGPLQSRGFIPDSPVRIREGREEWTVLAEGTRESVSERLDAVRAEADADIEVVRITPPESAPTALLPEDALSERQREAFELARDRGYYEWPRNVSGTELAAEWDVSKATFLEHLRKAEAKLLGP